MEKFSIPFLPFEASGIDLGMGPIPFFIHDREELDDIVEQLTEEPKLRIAMAIAA